jgi:hypothetical protein
MSDLMELVIGVYILAKLCCVIEDQIRTNYVSLIATTGVVIASILICVSIIKVIIVVAAKMIYPII